MPDPLSDWINEYIEWNKASGHPIRDERIEELKESGHVIIGHRGDDGKDASKTFGTVPKIPLEVGLNFLKACCPEKWATINLQAMGFDIPDGLSREELNAFLDKKLEEEGKKIAEAEAAERGETAKKSRRRIKSQKLEDDRLIALHRKRAELDAEIDAQRAKIKKIRDD